MLFNQTVAWRPASIVQNPRRVMAQAIGPIQPTIQKLPLVVSALALTFAIAMGGATAWVGFDTGSRRKGLLSILGYVVGAGGAISAAIDLVALGVVGYAAIKIPSAPAASTNVPLM